MRRRRRVLILGCLLAGFGLTLYLRDLRFHFWPHNFSEVHAAKVFRSGYQCEMPLRRLVEEHGIKTVIRLADRTEHVAFAQERSVLKTLDVSLVEIFLRGCSGPELVQRVNQALAIAVDPDQQPVLIHCVRGKDRTGAVVSAYRLKHQGWPMDRTHSELVQRGVPHGKWPHSFLDLYHRKLLKEARVRKRAQRRRLAGRPTALERRR